MTPDLIFWLSLIAKMAVTAGFVVGATVVAERGGPLLGGLALSIPISTGAVYAFLALDHDAAFIANSAIWTLVGNGPSTVIAFVYVLMAQRNSLPVSYAVAFASWAALTVVVFQFNWSIEAANIFAYSVLLPAFWVTRSLRRTTASALKPRAIELVARASGIALLVGIAVALSHTIGPRVSGLIAVFPIVISSAIVILHLRLGGRAAAAVIANIIVGMMSFPAVVTTLYLAVEPLGSPIALLLALAVSLAINGAIYGIRRLRSKPV